MTKIINPSLVICYLISCILFTNVSGQEITGPLFYINNSNVTASAACVNQSNPNRSAIAEYNGPAGFFGPGTVFILELSDANGVFQDPVVELDRFTSATALGSSADLDFGPFLIPADTQGENYSLRVRDENSQVIGMTENIPIYYFDSDQGLELSGPNQSASNVALCSGDSVTLSAFPDDQNAYIWLFNGTVIPGETGSTLTNVSQTGSYVVRIDFGFCSDFFTFNSASTQVFDFDTNTVFISEEDSSPISFCPQDIKLLSSSITDPAYTYEWFLNDQSISNSDTPFLSLPDSNFEGTYTLLVTVDDNCSILTNPVEVINAGANIFIQSPPQLILLPDETIELEIIAETSQDISIQWFQDGIPISGANSLSLNVTSPGLYRAEVIVNDSCMSLFETEVEVFSPSDFRSVISQMIDCNDNTSILELTELYGITTGGLEIPLSSEQYSFFNFEWIKGTTFTGVTDSTFLVSSADENDIYTLNVILNSSGAIVNTSNQIIISFPNDDLVIESNPEFLPVGESLTLSVNNNNSYTYQWFIEVNGSYELIPGETNSTLEVFELGNYKVIISYETCSIELEINVRNEPGISSVIPNVITPKSSLGINDNWVLPNEFRMNDISVKIYRVNGKLDFEISGGYNEEWPSNSISGANDLLYFYVISKNQEVIRKGTITIIK